VGTGSSSRRERRGWRRANGRDRPSAPVSDLASTKHREAAVTDDARRITVGDTSACHQDKAARLREQLRKHIEERDRLLAAVAQHEGVPGWSDRPARLRSEEAMGAQGPVFVDVLPVTRADELRRAITAEELEIERCTALAEAREARIVRSWMDGSEVLAV
jgi:hypothetical protein